MFDREPAPDALRRLPLTESNAAASAPVRVSDEDVRRLVDSFYARVREDDLLGPIFAREVGDWSLHLPKMVDFWSTVILHSGRYSGRPIEAHLRLEDLTPAHFERWLRLWESTVPTEIPAPGRDAFVLAARRMAASMQARIFTPDARN